MGCHTHECSHNDPGAPTLVVSTGWSWHTVSCTLGWRTRASKDLDRLK